jgi:hypothetical protein
VTSPRRSRALHILALVIALVAQPRAARAYNSWSGEYRKFPWHAGTVRHVTTAPGECPHCPSRESPSAWKAIDVGDMDYETVYAVSGGVVDVYSHGQSKAGDYVRIKDADGTFVTYEHLARAVVGRGDGIVAGQPIGTSGCTGNCHGAHLHFQRQSGAAFSSDARDLTPISGYTTVARGAYTSDNAGIGHSSADVLAPPIAAAYAASGGYGSVGAAANIGELWSPCQDDAIPGTWWRYGCDARAGTGGSVQTFLAGSPAKQRTLMLEQGAATAFLLTRGILGAYTTQMNGHDWVHWLGYPTSARFAITGGYRQNFRGGYITIAPPNCAENVVYAAKVYSYSYCD